LSRDVHQPHDPGLEAYKESTAAHGFQRRRSPLPIHQAYLRPATAIACGKAIALLLYRDFLGCLIDKSGTPDHDWQQARGECQKSAGQPAANGGPGNTENFGAVSG